MQNDFSYFFNPNGREQCYISPERFYVSSDAQGIWRQQAALQLSMVSMCQLEHLTSCLGLYIISVHAGPSAALACVKTSTGTMSTLPDGRLVLREPYLLHDVCWGHATMAILCKLGSEKITYQHWTCRPHAMPGSPALMPQAA